MLQNDPELFELSMSEKTQPLMDLVKKHCLHRWPDFFTNKEIFDDKLESFHDIREQIAFNIRPYDYWTQMDHEEEIGPVFRCDFENTLVNIVFYSVHLYLLFIFRCKFNF